MGLTALSKRQFLRIAVLFDFPMGFGSVGHDFVRHYNFWGTIVDTGLTDFEAPLLVQSCPSHVRKPYCAR